MQQGGDLAYFESLARAAMVSPPQERQQAASAVAELTQNTNNVKMLMTALTQSQSHFAVYIASSALESIFTNFFNSFNPDDRKDIRRLLREVLGNRAEWLCLPGHEIVRTSLCQFAARVWRLSWFEMTTDQDDDSSGDDAVMEDAQRALAGLAIQRDDILLHEFAFQLLDQSQNSLAYGLLGCTVLIHLIRDMSYNLSHFSGAKQRKIAIVFRDKSLLPIFQRGLALLSNIRTVPVPPQEPATSIFKFLLRDNLQLILGVLNFDFIGTQPDESSDDGGIIHVPTAWSSVFEGSASLQLLLELYYQFDAPHSTMVLEILASLVAVRNSLYRTADTRNLFLQNLFMGIGKILETEQGLQHEDNRHQICRLLLRLKSNFQLTHFLKLDSYQMFMNLVARFNVKVFETTSSVNSIYYLLQFWSRVVTATNYISADDSPPTGIGEIAPRIFYSLVETQLQKEEHVTGCLDELLSDKQLPSLLEAAYKLAQAGKYSEIVEFLLRTIDRIATNYQNFAGPHPPPASAAHAVPLLERQLAWLVYIVTSVTNGSIITTREEDEILDASLLALAFDLLKLHDQRLSRFGPTEATEFLETAFAGFLRKFVRLYFNDPSIEKSKMHAAMTERHGLSTPQAVVEAILSKIVMNLKFWSHSDVAMDTLELFFTMATTRMSCNLMAKSALVQHLMANHTDLNIGDVPRNRYEFYRTMGKLLYREPDYEQFEVFARPFDQRLMAIKSAFDSGVVNQEVSTVLSNVCHSLRGVLNACYAAKGFEIFFDWFYPAGYYTSVIGRGLEMLMDKDWKAVWSIMKFVNEFAANRHRRVQFPTTSADGIRLFRDTANILLLLGNAILRMTDATNQAAELVDIRFKCVMYFMRTLADLLTGDYASIGVFQIYNDNILPQLFGTTYRIIFSINSAFYKQYPKTTEALFVALEMICVHDVGLLFSTASESLPDIADPILLRLLRLLRAGLRNDKTRIVSCCAVAMDKLVSYQLTSLVRRRRPAPAPLVEPVFQKELMMALFDVFELLITDRENIHWTLSKPFCSLIVLLPEAMQTLQQVIVSSQEPEKARMLVEHFSKLSTGFDRNIKPENRERFTSNTTSFRADVRTYIDLDAMYRKMAEFFGE